MWTVHEVSRRTGVTIRTLQYYDRIGLLRPAERTEAGYRLYDEEALERLQQILLFREMEFPLKEIGRILKSPAFDRDKALEQQIALLEMKKEHVERLIALARDIKEKKGERRMDFSAFDTKKMEEYAAQAKASWGQTAEYREYQEKAAGRTREESGALGEQLMGIFAEFGAVKTGDPGGETAQALVRKLQGFITAHYYACSPQALAGLGKMYAAGGEMTENIDRAGGAGAAAFAAEAIRIFCAAQ